MQGERLSPMLSWCPAVSIFPAGCPAGTSRGKILTRSLQVAPSQLESLAQIASRGAQLWPELRPINHHVGIEDCHDWFSRFRLYAVCETSRRIRSGRAAASSLRSAYADMNSFGSSPERERRISSRMSFSIAQAITVGRLPARSHLMTAGCVTPNRCANCFRVIANE